MPFSVIGCGGEQIIKLQSEFGGKRQVAPGKEVIMTMKKWPCIIEFIVKIIMYSFKLNENCIVFFVC